MKKIIEKVYAIDELSEKAKEKAIEFISERLWSYYDDIDIKYYISELTEQKYHMECDDVDYSIGFSQGDYVHIIFEDIPKEFLQKYLEKYNATHEKKIKKVVVDCINEYYYFKYSGGGDWSAESCYSNIPCTPRLDKQIDKLLDYIAYDIREFELDVLRPQVSDMILDYTSKENCIEYAIENDYYFYEDGRYYLGEYSKEWSLL